MSDSPQHTGDLLEAIIPVEGVDNPSGEKAVREALETADSVQVLAVSDGKVTVRYDPTRVVEADLAAKLAQIGHRADAPEIGRISPVADSGIEPSGRSQA